MMQAGVVLVGTSLALSTQQFAWVNLALVSVWIVVLVGIYREHRKLVQS